MCVDQQICVGLAKLVVTHSTAGWTLHKDHGPKVPLLCTGQLKIKDLFQTSCVSALLVQTGPSVVAAICQHVAFTSG
eukprot:2329015-Amphidinium_carterae.1